MMRIVQRLLPLVGFVLFTALTPICVAQPLSLAPHASWPGYPSGYVTAFTVVSNTAYVIAYNSLQIFDVHDMNRPIRLTGLTLGYSFGKDIAVANGIAYVLDGNGQLLTFNVSNPTNPILLSSTYMHSTPDSLTISGNRCFVSQYASIGIYDISNPANPIWLSDAWIAGQTAIEGDYIYSLDGIYGLAIADAQDPTNVVQLTWAPTMSEPRDVFVTNHIAYVVTGYGLEMFNVANPNAPVTLGKAHVPGARRLSLRGHEAFLTSSSGLGNLHVIDVSNPAAPTLINEINSSVLEYPGEIQVVNSTIFLADENLEIFDATDLQDLRYVGWATTYWYSGSVEVAGDFAYVGNLTAGLDVLDVSDPKHPVQVGHHDTQTDMNWPRKNGDYLYVSEWLDLVIFDAHDPLNLVRLATLPNLAGKISAVGNLAYVANGWDGLRILDISNPTNPIPIGQFDTTGNAYDVKVQGPWAYVADYADGLQILDVSSPAVPALVGSAYTGGLAEAVAVSGDYAILADGQSGWTILDVSDPVHPTIVTNVPAYGWASDVQIVGDRAYGCDLIRVRVIDISHPTKPVILAEAGIRDMGQGLAVSGNKVYVATSEWGLNIFELTPLVLNPPVISGGAIQLSWPGGPGIKLQKSSSLTSPVWQDVPDAAGLSEISLPANGPAAFFRLTK